MPTKEGVPTLSDLLGQASNLGDSMIKQQQFQQQQQQPFELAKQKAQLGGEAQQRELDQAKNIVNEGSGVGKRMAVKVGDTSVAEQEENPLKYMMKNQQYGNKALSHAYDTYMKAFPEVQKRAQSASEGLEAVNDPNQVGSIGQAKTLLIKNLGMNRYNQQEGNALVPGNLSQIFHQMYNTVGGDENPLTDTQRQAMNTVFHNSLQIAKKQHDMAKNNALGSYMQSGYADPMQAQQFKSQVGQDFDKQLNDTVDRFKEVPKTVGYQPPGSGSQSVKPPPSMVDRLKSMFSPSQPPQPSQPQQAPPTMSFEEFKKRKAAGQL